MYLSKFFPQVVKMVFVAAFVLAAGDMILAAPTPFALSGNPSCSALNASTDPRLAHMTESWEFKIDPPQSGTFALVSASGRQVINMTANPNLFLNVALNSSGTQMTSWSLSWNAPQNVDRLISAIIVKGGPQGANIYPYNPLDAGDTGTFTVPTGQQISHLSFCFEPFIGPSAADASISGRVLNAAGGPISGAVVTILNLNTGETKQITTGTFGKFAVKGLPVNNFYTVSVRARRYFFSDPVRTFELAEDLSEFDFVAY